MRKAVKAVAPTGSCFLFSQVDQSKPQFQRKIECPFSTIETKITIQYRIALEDGKILDKGTVTYHRMVSTLRASDTYVDRRR